MSQIELVISYSKKIEGILENNFGAQGRGLHTKLTSIEQNLPNPLIKKIRWIATVRNNVAHTDGYQLDDIADFKNACEAVLSELKTISEKNLRLVEIDTDARASEQGIQIVYIRKTNRLLVAFFFLLGAISGMATTRGLDILGFDAFASVPFLSNSQYIRANQDSLFYQEGKDEQAYRKKAKPQRDEHLK